MCCHCRDPRPTRPPGSPTPQGRWTGLRPATGKASWIRPPRPQWGRAPIPFRGGRVAERGVPRGKKHVCARSRSSPSAVCLAAASCAERRRRAQGHRGARGGGAHAAAGEVPEARRCGSSSWKRGGSTSGAPARSRWDESSPRPSRRASRSAWATCAGSRASRARWRSDRAHGASGSSCARAGRSTWS